MLLKKQGYPEEGELVFCEVTKVQYNSVFVNIEDYNKSGLIHISEISPGRIRNIRDYVKEGKMIVCKVLKTDEKKGHIDLSLRRVTEIQRRKKTNERKQEQKAEKIIEILAKRMEDDVGKVYKEISTPLFKDYELLQQAFEDVVEEKLDLKKYIDKKYVEKLEELIKEKITPKEVSIRGTLSLTTYIPRGINAVKESLKAAEKATDRIEIKYLGAGKYSLEVKAKEYKEAEEKLKKALEEAESIMNKNEGVIDFKRKEKV